MASSGLDRLAVFKKAGSAAVVRPLGALASMLTRIQGNLYQAPDDMIPGMKATDWPSPLQPVRPFGPPDAQPLGFNMQMGQNLIFTPRPDSRYTAADLQALARYPLARMCITNVLDTISSLKWKIQLRAQPGEDQKVREARQLKDDTILKLTDFVAAPDGENDFKMWVRPLINDMLTIDAGNYLMRKAPDGTVFEWRTLQGAYITRYVDANGYTPAAPAPAFGQNWDGVVRVYMSVDQLVYRPRNIVYEVGNPWSALYGLSPTEALAEELEIGIQRLRYVKAFYKDGSIPNVLWVVPADTQPDIVKAAMTYLNSDMSGNLESRRMFRMAQGFRGSDSPKEEFIKQFEEPKLSDEYDDLHIKKVCFGYGVSAQRLTRPMNRASAQTSQEAAEEEGIAPFRAWVEDAINWGIQRRMGYLKYEFKFDTSRDPDPAKQAEIDQQDLNGKMTLDEVRARAGLDAINSENSGKVGKWLVSGWAAMDDGIIVPPKSGASGSADGNDLDDDEPPPAAGKGGKQKFAKADANAVTLDPGRDTIRSRAAQAQLQARFSQFFHSVRSTMVIVDPHVKAISPKMRKADEPPDAETQKQIEQIVEAIMSSIPWQSLPDYIQPAIQEAATDGATIGLDQVERAIQSGPLTVSLAPAPVRVITSSVISDVNQVAMDYARKRGAELVGMKWVDGELVQNPNAAMAITDSTRNMLREILTDAFSREVPMSELVSRIQAAGVFSEERAKFIADTEIRFAQARGNLEAWIKTGVVQTVKWLLSMLHVDDETEECTINHDEGPIAIGKLFPSGDPAPPAHPRCLPGDALISPGQVISAVSAREYHGEIVVIRTETGKQLSITPNHPVLTDRGWVAAALLREGDRVVSSLTYNREAFLGNDNENVPTTIKDIAEAFLGSGKVATEEVEVSSKDFHGDAADGEVAVVGTDSRLTAERNASVAQQNRKAFFNMARASDRGLSNASGASQQESLTPQLAANGGVGGGGDIESVLRGCLTHPEILCIAGIADVDAGLDQDSPDDATGNGVLLCQTLLASSPRISSKDSGNIQGQTPGMSGLNAFGADNGQLLSGQMVTADKGGLRAAPQIDALLTEDAPHDFGRNRLRPRESTGTHPTEIRLDKIVSVEFDSFAGHVYNLETMTGWYVADSIVVHNCRCGLGIATIQEKKAA